MDNVQIFVIAGITLTVIVGLFAEYKRWKRNHSEHAHIHHHTASK